MRILKKFAVIIPAVICILFFFGKAFATENAIGALNPQKKVKIALLLPTNGKLSYFSKQFINGIFLSEKNFKNQKVRYIIINLPITSGSRAIGYIFSSLNKEGVGAIIGPLFSRQLKYFKMDSIKYKIPVITPSPIFFKRDTSPYMFSYGMTLKQEVRAEVQYAGYSGVKSLTVIYPDGSYGSVVIRYINRFAKKYNVNIVNSTGYSDNTVDFFDNFNQIVHFQLMQGHISKAEEKELGVTKFDLMHGITKRRPGIPFNGIFLIGSPSKLKLILTQLMYYNITGMPIFGLSSFDSNHLISKYGFYMNNAIFPNGFLKNYKNSIVKNFVSSYKKLYGINPNILSGEGYDIGGILINAASKRLRSNNLPGKGVAFYDALLTVRYFKGVCGISNLKANVFKKNLYLFKFKNNKIYVLENPF